jgi:hypothetical protein
MKKSLPSDVVMFQRGAPAPQCDPRGPADRSAPGLRMSQPSSAIVVGGFVTTAKADALFAVGPVFASSRPSTRLSFGSPVAQAGSVMLSGAVVSNVGGWKT